MNKNTSLCCTLLNLTYFLRSSKWYVTLEEYPFDRYPPFITAGNSLNLSIYVSAVYFYKPV